MINLYRSLQFPFISLIVICLLFTNSFSHATSQTTPFFSEALLSPLSPQPDNVCTKLNLGSFPGTPEIKISWEPCGPGEMYRCPIDSHRNCKTTFYMDICISTHIFSDSTGNSANVSESSSTPYNTTSDINTSTRSDTVRNSKSGPNSYTRSDTRTNVDTNSESNTGTRYDSRNDPRYHTRNDDDSDINSNNRESEHSTSHTTPTTINIDLNRSKEILELCATESGHTVGFTSLIFNPSTAIPAARISLSHCVKRKLHLSSSQQPKIALSVYPQYNSCDFHVNYS